MIGDSVVFGAYSIVLNTTTVHLSLWVRATLHLTAVTSTGAGTVASGETVQLEARGTATWHCYRVCHHSRCCGAGGTTGNRWCEASEGVCAGDGEHDEVRAHTCVRAVASRLHVDMQTASQ